MTITRTELPMLPRNYSPTNQGERRYVWLIGEIYNAPYQNAKLLLRPWGSRFQRVTLEFRK